MQFIVKLLYGRDSVPWAWAQRASISQVKLERPVGNWYNHEMSPYPQPPYGTWVGARTIDQKDDEPSTEGGARMEKEWPSEDEYTRENEMVQRYA